MASLSKTDVLSSPFRTFHFNSGNLNWGFIAKLSIASVSGNTTKINYTIYPACCKTTTSPSSASDLDSSESSWVYISSCMFFLNGTQINSSPMYAPPHQGQGYKGAAIGVESAHVVMSGQFTVTGTSFSIQFKGGYYEHSYEGAVGAGHNSDFDVTITIQGLNHKVTFNGNGGTISGQTTRVVEVEHGGSATMPTFTRSGYTQTNAGQTYTNITSDATYYAEWKINSFNVTFDLKGGTRTGGGELSQTVNSGGNANPPTAKYTGYYDMQNALSGTANSYWDNDWKNITAARTINAVWVKQKFTVTFNLNGGTATGELIQSVEYGGSATAPTNVTKIGYTFKKWDKDFTNVTSNLTVNAVYDVNSYTVSYDANGGVGAPATQTANFGTTIKLSSSKPTKSHKITLDPNGGRVTPITIIVPCQFVHWNTSANDSGTSYEPGQSYTVQDSNLVLYAIWKDVSIDQYNSTSTSKLEIPDPTPADSRLYQFDRWTKTVNSLSTEFKTSEVITKDITIYAAWLYRVSLNPNGGYFILDSTEEDDPNNISYDADIGWKTTGQAYNIYRKAANIRGECKGWSLQSTSTDIAYPNTEGSTYTKEAPVDLYLVWEIREVTVTFREGYGANRVIKQTVVVEGESVKDEDFPVYPSDEFPQRPGPYGFVGWAGNTENVTENTDVTAMWEFSPIWVAKTERGRIVWKPYKPKE